jgi:hypothetical protein
MLNRALALHQLDTNYFTATALTARKPMYSEKPSLRPWQIPLTEKQKEENIRDIIKRHNLMLEIGEAAFRALGKKSVPYRIENED